MRGGGGGGGAGDSAATASAARSFAAFDARNAADASQGPPPRVSEEGGWGIDGGTGLGGVQQIAMVQRAMAAQGESQLDERPGRVLAMHNTGTETEDGDSSPGLGNHVRRDMKLGYLGDDVDGDGGGGPVQSAPTEAEAANLSAIADAAINAATAPGEIETTVSRAPSAAGPANNGNSGGGGKKDSSGAAQAQDKTAAKAAELAKRRAAERTKSLVAVKRFWKAEVERDPMAILSLIDIPLKSFREYAESVFTSNPRQGLPYIARYAIQPILNTRTFESYNIP
jgi:hypothetical protein